MKIVLCLFAMFVICGLAGFGLVSLRKRANGVCNEFVMQIGYAYILCMFYLTYSLLKDGLIAVIITCAVPIAVLIFRLIILAKSRNKIAISYKFNPYLVLAIAAILVLASWPYVVSGWGNYWHNGNYDIEDGLNGRDAYINHQIYDDHPFSLEKLTGGSVGKDAADNENTPSAKSNEKDSYYSWYAGDGFRFQYSNLAFWSIALGEKYAMDIELVHSIFNLILTLMSVYSFARVFFAMNGLWSSIAAFSSIASSFYLGTFWAGHIGSMMYGVVAPMLATFILSNKTKDEWIDVFPWICLGVISTAFTYPQALFLGLCYWLGSHEYTEKLIVAVKDRVQTSMRAGGKTRFLIGLFVLLAVLAIVVYELWMETASYRIRQDGQYRAWGLVHDLGILPVVFGYIPAPSALFNAYIYYGLTATGLATLSVFLYALKNYKLQRSGFVRIFVVLWLLGLLFFYVFIRDSYYIYKYMYTHIFVFIVIFCAFISASVGRKWKKFAAALVLINLGSDVVAGYTIHEMAHNNRSGEYDKLAKVNSNILRHSFVDLTGGDSVAVRQTLKRYNINTERDSRFAKYFIVRRGTGGDITGDQLGDVVFSTDIFEIRKTPEKNYLMVRTWFESEVYKQDPQLGSTPYRWIAQGVNDNADIFIIRPDHSSDDINPFLRICGQKGPGSIGLTMLTVTDGAGTYIGGGALGGASCIWLDAFAVKSAVQPLVLKSTVVDSTLRLTEDRKLVDRLFSLEWKDRKLVSQLLSVGWSDRKLLYRIFSVGWVKQRYDTKALLLFNPVTGVQGTLRPDAVVYGNGWWPPEEDKNERFRWAADGAEFLVPNQCVGQNRMVTLDIETGPSHGDSSGEFAVQDEKGSIVFQTRLPSKRGRIIFPIPHGGIYRLSTGSDHIQVPGDFRILDFRLLGLRINGC